MQWLFNIGLGKYPHVNWGIRRLGKGRYALDMWKFSLRAEFLDYR